MPSARSPLATDIVPKEKPRRRRIDAANPYEEEP
jgi:hypothetical protein